MHEVGKEYGAALFLLACETGEQAAYADALQTVSELFSENPDYPAFLASPAILQSRRLDAIEAAFADRLPAHVVSFLKLLCEKGRMGCFDAAVREYRALYNASLHVFEAQVTCASALTDGEKERLKARLESIYGGQVQMAYTVDPTLLGGLIVEIDGNIMDGSLRRRLRDVKEVMNV